jgi:hypothetical protein
LVGTVYRTKDGSKPAAQIITLLKLFEGAAEKKLEDWVKEKRQKITTKKKTPKVDFNKISEVKKRIESSGTQSELRNSITYKKLSASEWRELAKQVTGVSASSGKAASELVEKHFSDELLVKERVQRVSELANHSAAFGAAGRPTGRRASNSRRKRPV